MFNKKEIKKLNDCINDLYDKYYDLNKETKKLFDSLENRLNSVEIEIKIFNDFLVKNVVPLKEYLGVETEVEYVADPCYPPVEQPKMPVYKFVKKSKSK